VDFEQAATQARQVRAAFAAFERRQYGREWCLSDLVGGLATDVGDLARLIAAKQGLRPAPEDLDAALAHERSDCLWSLLVLADAVGVDLARAFEQGMSELKDWLEQQDQLPPGRSDVSGR
jgi:NTP pyrophosphatase (non-canonical NTP hydrolase)